MVRACRSLTALHLLRCGGLFGHELGEAFASRRPLLPLAELHLCEGASALTDAGLAQCLSRQGWSCADSRVLCQSPLQTAGMLEIMRMWHW